jgi:hypothetical protein
MEMRRLILKFFFVSLQFLFFWQGIWSSYAEAQNAVKFPILFWT